MRHTKLICGLTLILGLVASTATAQDDEQAIRRLTDEFCQAMVSKNLEIIDRIFDPDPSNIYYDINEGPLLGLPNLKRVWRAATTNYTISRFEFMPDMRITVTGDRALQTGKWQQVQEQGAAFQREIVGRATILWKRTPEGWRVYHYHASITPRGR